MKRFLPILMLVISGGLLRAQCDPGSKLRPAPDLPSFRQTPIGSSGGIFGNCSKRSAPASSTPNCPSGMCQARLDYTPLAGDKEDQKIILERLRQIHGSYPQISRALNEISNVIHHIEEQTGESASLSPSDPSGQRLARQSLSEVDRPQARKDSSRLEQRYPLLPQPIVSQGQDSAASLGEMGVRSFSYALNTPQKRILASGR
jgi:hypothetical protein